MVKINLNAKVIRDYIKEHNLTIKKFCEKCNITYYNYRQIIKNDTAILSHVLFNIIDTINVPLDAILKVEYTHNLHHFFRELGDGTD